MTETMTMAMEKIIKINKKTTKVYQCGDIHFGTFFIAKNSGKRKDETL